MTWFGYVIFCLIASLFLQRYGIKRSLLAGYFLICAGCVATLFAPTFWMASLTLMIVNAGFGFFEVGTNALGMVAFTRRAALMMNLLHFFYGFGAILGPKTAGLLTKNFGFTWQGVYITIIAPTAVCFIFILFARMGKSYDRGNREETASGITFYTALKNPFVLIFALTLGFMEIIEFGAANWGGLYLQDVYGLDPRIVGANFVALFYILFTLSRLASGLIIEKVGYMRSLFASVIFVIILFSSGFLLGRNGIWVLPVTGLFIAVMWPTIMAVAMNVFGKDAPVISAVIITVSGAINGLFQLIIGYTNQFIGEAWGYRSCLLYAIFALAMLYLLSNRLKYAAKTY